MPISFMVTVVIPVYNCATGLRKCINSVLRQTYERLQIILVNDGSTDGSENICDEYAEIDSRIEVIHQKNSGPSLARKKGIERACGEFIGFVDGDDYIEPDFFESMLFHIIETQVDFVYCGHIEEKDNQYCVKKPSYELVELGDNRIGYLEEDMFAFEVARNVMIPSIWSKLFKTSFLKKCYIHVPEQLFYGEDLILKYSCIMECNRFVIIPYAGYHYIVQENSLSHDSSINSFVKECSLYTELCKWARDYEIYDRLKWLLSSMLRIRLITCMNNLYENGVFVPCYLFTNVGVLSGKRVLLYGAGLVGKSYYSQLIFYRECQIVAWADQKHVDVEDGFLITPGAIMQKEYDLILIAVKHRHIADEIIAKLTLSGVENNKIVWSKPELNI